MKVFLQMTVGFVLAMLSILSIVIFLLPGGVSAKGKYESLVTLEKQLVTTHVNADGTNVETEEVTRLIKSQLAVDSNSQVDIPFNSSFQNIDVLEAYTILASGKKLPVAANAIRYVEDDISDGANQFSDRKHCIIIFPSVSAGTRIYYKVKTTTHTALFPKNYENVMYFSLQEEEKQFEFNFSHDPKIQILTDVKGVSGGRIADGPRGEIRYRFTHQSSDISIKEPAQVSELDFAPRIILSTFKSHVELGKAYENSLKSKLVVTKDVRELAEKITKGITQPKDQAKALYQWVSKNIRYVAIYLGAGGVVPNDVDTIIHNQYGDCKDHDLLLRALLTAKGIQSSTALINAGRSYVYHPLGTISPNNHAITYLPTWDLYVDTTQEIAPFGVLIDQLLDKPTVLTALEKIGRTPKLLAETNRVTTKTTLKILPDGKVSGTTYSTYTGPREMDARYKYANYVPLSEDRMVKNHLYAFRQTGIGSFSPTDPYDLNKSFELGSQFTLDPIVNMPGPGAMTIPVGLGHGGLVTLSYNRPPEVLKYPYVCKSETLTESYLLLFPQKTKITRVPVNVHFEEQGIFYQASYVKKDEGVQVDRTLKTSRPSIVCKPEDIERWRRVHQVIQKDLLAQIFYE